MKQVLAGIFDRIISLLMTPGLTKIVDWVISLLSKSSTMAKWIFFFILFGVKVLLILMALFHPWFKARLREKNFTAQISTKDESMGRYFTFMGERIVSKGGIHPQPDMTITYRDAALGARLMPPWRNQLEQISAMKAFKIWIMGPDELTSWFTETLSLMLTAGIGQVWNMALMSEAG